MNEVSLVGVVTIAILLAFLLGAVGYLVRRRTRPPATPPSEETIDNGVPGTVRGDVATVATPAATATAPESAAPQLPAPPAVVDSQCPRCGRFDLERSSAGWHCNWCQHRWSVAAGEQWPDVALRLWLPQTPATAEPVRLQGDDQHDLST